MAEGKLERVRAMLPPDGTDLREVFVEGGGFSSQGLVSDDATVRFVASDAEASAQGPEGFRDTWADWLEPWETYVMFTDDLVDRDDRVIVLTRLRGVTKRDGVEMEHEGAAVFRFDGEQIVEIEFNLNREDALSS